MERLTGQFIHHHITDASSYVGSHSDIFEAMSNLPNETSPKRKADATADSSADATLDLILELDESPLVENIKKPDWVQETNSNPTDQVRDEYQFDDGTGNVL